MRKSMLGGLFHKDRLLYWAIDWSRNGEYEEREITIMEYEDE